jgi:PTH1 family peptidyl-tRNA hydrolase
VTALSRFLGLFRRKSPPAKVQCLIFGIGNPGEKYWNTRHNAGFMAIDRLSSLLTNVRTVHSSSFEASCGMLAGKTVALVKPATFVNSCGPAFAQCLSTFGVSKDFSLVIVDDFHLSLGAIRIRRSGSDGGHNGLTSIIEQCGQDFPRLRVGIGPLPTGVGLIDFVLGTFDDKEKTAVEDAVKKTCDAVESFCTLGVDKAMNLFNKTR